MLCKMQISNKGETKMQGLNFAKAVLMAQKGMRYKLANDTVNEKCCQEAILQFTREPEKWIKEVKPDTLIYLQYLYTVWKKAGTEIFSYEDYMELFYTEEFVEYKLKNQDSTFERIMENYTEENVNQFWLDVRLEKLSI